jgi:hypothetical protein
MHKSLLPLVVHIFDTSFIHSAVLQQVHRLFPSEFSTECDLVPPILIYSQQDAKLHSLFYLKTALHVSGGIITYHQGRKQLSLQYRVFVTLLLLPAAIVEELERGVRHPQHTQTGSISSTITAGSSNGVINIRCCRYSCLCS